MSSRAVREEELVDVLQGVFSIEPELELEIAGLSGELGGEDDSSVDRAWAQRVYPRLENWLNRLEAINRSYQDRVALFLNTCQQYFPSAKELFEETGRLRLERAWGAVTEYFESVMPKDLAQGDHVDFYIDTNSLVGWWTAEFDEDGVVLADAVLECLQTAGEFSQNSANQIRDLFLKSLTDGTAPLPGFNFKEIREELSVWTWNSTESEFPAISQDIDLGAQACEVQFICENAAELAALKKLSKDLQLPAMTIEHVRDLVQRGSSIGVGTEFVLRNVGMPLAICTYKALTMGDVTQLRRAIDALQILKSEMKLGPEPITEDQGPHSRRRR